MNEEIKAQWVTALRSGDFRQGRGRLGYRKVVTDGLGNVDVAAPIEPTYHCCLGVLCELAVEAGVVERDEYVVRSDIGRVDYRYGGDDTYLPPAVAHWAGFATSAHSVSYEEMNPVVAGTALAVVNDNHRETFDGIAQLIEEYL